MRFIKIAAFLLIAFLTGCNTNGPKIVAGKFLTAMFKLDFAKAKEFGTDDTNKMLDMMSGFAKMMPDSAKRTEIKFKIINSTEDGDKATVTYKEDGTEREQSVPLVKINGDWKVNIGKDIMNSEMTGDNEPLDEDSIQTVPPADSAR
jgi:hypothetical protein